MPSKVIDGATDGGSGGLLVDSPCCPGRRTNATAIRKMAAMIAPTVFDRRLDAFPGSVGVGGGSAG